MVGAVVEVLVAEEPAPALLAVALPRLATRPVQAARVADALGAGGALPAHATLAAPGGLAVAVLFTAVRRADGWMEGEGEGERGGVLLQWTRPPIRLSYKHTHKAPRSDLNSVPDFTIG